MSYDIIMNALNVNFSVSLWKRDCYINIISCHIPYTYVLISRRAYEIVKNTLSSFV